jgi:hypothetical protein
MRSILARAPYFANQQLQQILGCSEPCVWTPAVPASAAARVLQLACTPGGPLPRRSIASAGGRRSGKDDGSAAAAGSCAWLDIPEGRIGVSTATCGDHGHAHEAAQAAWAGLNRALGGRPPTFVLLSTSFAHGVLSPLTFLAGHLSEARDADGNAPPLMGGSIGTLGERTARLIGAQ